MPGEGWPPLRGDDAPRWDHRDHYDQAMVLLGEGAWQAAAVHMLAALYRLLEARPV